MNKREYMDILIDYLSQNVSYEDKIEILRDVEEIIEEGKLSGRSEEQIVNNLGSPKTLVLELKGEEAFFDKSDTDDFIKESINNKKAKRVNLGIKNKVNLEKLNKFKFGEFKGLKSFLRKFVKICMSLLGLLIVIPFTITFITLIITIVILIGVILTGTIFIASVSTSFMFAGIFSMIFMAGGIFMLLNTSRYSMGICKTLLETIRDCIVSKGDVSYE